MPDTLKRLLNQGTAVSLRKRSLANIAGGFTILVILIVLVAGISLYKMHIDQARFQYVLDQHVGKLDLISEMRNAARERTIAMQKLILLDDPFEQDDIFLYFNRLGGQFARARLRYLDMALGDEEQAILDEQGRLTGANVPHQRRITELVAEGRKQEAHQLLVDVAIPGQDKVLEQLDRLHDLQKAAAQRAVALQASDYHQALTLIVIVVVLIITIAVVVAVVVFSSSRRYEKALFESRQKAVVTLRSIGDAVISVDESGRIDYMNMQAEKLTGLHLSEVNGQPLAEYLELYRQEQPVDYAALFKVDNDKGGLQLHELILKARGQRHVVELTLSSLHDEAGLVSGNVMALRDISAIRALDEEVKYQAAHDSLTGLYNRHEFERRIQKLLERARIDQSEHAVCYFDLDMFKAVNDTCGHIAGDELLRQLAMVLQGAIRKTDTLARVGGDEFALLLQSCSIKEARAIAEKFLELVMDFRFHWQNHSFQVGASIGVAPIRSDSGTLVDIMQTADFACYSAKDAGRNRVHTAEVDTDMVETRRGHAYWMGQVKEALEHDSFEIYYQDIRPLNADSDQVRRAELLLRMRDEKGEPVSPMAFMPAAERYHIMPQIDRWVITRCLELLASAMLPPKGYQWYLNINLSGQSFSDSRFLDFVQTQIRDSGVDPEFVGFEITETAAISNLAGAIRFMNTLRGMGCHFALDDFGSGLSSFGYLKNLPVDAVKIDGLFIRDLTEDFTHRAIVSSITQIAHAMNIRTIAEYVETDEVCRIVSELGVDYGQGYLFGRPQPFQTLVDARSAG